MAKTQIGILAILGATLLASACDGYHATRTTVSGYVRSVWCHGQNGGGCDVAIEGEDRSLQTIRFWNTPPVCVGLHCEIVYDSVEYSDSKESVSVKRID